MIIILPVFSYNLQFLLNILFFRCSMSMHCSLHSFIFSAVQYFSGCLHLLSCWGTFRFSFLFCYYKPYCCEHCQHISLGTWAMAHQGAYVEVEFQTTLQSYWVLPNNWPKCLESFICSLIVCEENTLPACGGLNFLMTHFKHFCDNKWVWNGTPL